MLPVLFWCPIFLPLLPSMLHAQGPNRPPHGTAEHSTLAHVFRLFVVLGSLGDCRSPVKSLDYTKFEGRPSLVGWRPSLLAVSRDAWYMPGTSIGYSNINTIISCLYQKHTRKQGVTEIRFKRIRPVAEIE